MADEMPADKVERSEETTEVAGERGASEVLEKGRGVKGAEREGAPAESKGKPWRLWRFSIGQIALIAIGLALAIVLGVKAVDVWQGGGNPVAFYVGPLEVRWYGILLMCGALGGALIAEWEAHRRGLNTDHVWNILLGGLISAVIVSRLWYVLGTRDIFSGDPLLIIGIRHGQWEGLRGLTIHGALIGAVLWVVIYAWWKHLDLWTWLDVGAIGFVLGQAIGRWGNFFNHEAFGLPTHLPWGLMIRPADRAGTMCGGIPCANLPEDTLFHPTFLYESLWNLAVCALLIFLARRYGDRLVRGELFWIYGMLYGVGRFALEFLRTDSLMLWGFPAAQVVSVALFAVCAGFLVARRWVWKKQPGPLPL